MNQIVYACFSLSQGFGLICGGFHKTEHENFFLELISWWKKHGVDSDLSMTKSVALPGGKI